MYIERCLVNESIPKIIFRFLRIPSLTSNDQKENINCTMNDVRGDCLRPPHGTTPAAVIENKTDLLRAVNIIMRKGIGQFALSATQDFSDPGSSEAPG